MKQHPVQRCPDHTRQAFDVYTLPMVVRWAEAELLKHKIEALVVCGHSGLIVAGALSYSMRIPVFAVRKQGEQCFGSSTPVSGIAPNGPVKRWAWLDDLISFGRTFRRSRDVAREAGLIDNDIPALVLLYAASNNGRDVIELNDRNGEEHSIPLRLYARDNPDAEPIDF